MCVCARMLSRQLIRGGSAPSQKWMLLTRKKTSSRPCAVSGTSDGLKEEQLGSSGRPPSHSSASEAPTDWTGREDREEAAASEASSACLASGALSRHVLCARTEEKNSSPEDKETLLLKLKSLYDKELISKEVYEKQQLEVLFK